VQTRAGKIGTLVAVPRAYAQASPGLVFPLHAAVFERFVGMRNIGSAASTAAQAAYVFMPRALATPKSRALAME